MPPTSHYHTVKALLSTRFTAYAADAGLADGYQLEMNGSTAVVTYRRAPEAAPSPFRQGRAPHSYAQFLTDRGFTTRRDGAAVLVPGPVAPHRTHTAYGPIYAGANSFGVALYNNVTTYWCDQCRWSGTIDSDSAAATAARGHREQMAGADAAAALAAADLPNPPVPALTPGDRVRSLIHRTARRATVAEVRGAWCRVVWERDPHRPSTFPDTWHQDLLARIEPTG